MSANCSDAATADHQNVYWLLLYFKQGGFPGFVRPYDQSRTIEILDKSMTELPKTLEDAIAQARNATQAAIEAGHFRLQVELAFPELKPMPVAEQFITPFTDLGPQLKVFFPDAGAAALARRDWGNPPFEVRGIGEFKAVIQPEDRVFILVAPSSVEVKQVETMSQEAGDRPFILLNPCLEDAAITGIGYAGRQLRERFLSTIETCYYLRPIEQGAILRAYPSAWQVWHEIEAGEYQVIAELDRKPFAEDLEQIFAPVTRSAGRQQNPSTSKPGLLTNLQRFLRALSQ